MTSMIICCVPGCKSNSKFKHSAFYQVKPEWRKLIVSYISKRIKEKNWTSHQVQSQTICARHLHLSGIRQGTLEEDMVHFPHLQISVLRKKQTEVAMKQIDRHDLVLDDQLGLGREVTVTCTAQPRIYLNREKPPNKLRKTKQHNDHTYTLSVGAANALREGLEGLKNENEILMNNMKEMAKQHEKEMQRLKDINHDLIKASIEAESKIVSPLTQILGSEPMLQFYTGFSSKATFAEFANFLRPGYELAKLQGKKEKSKALVQFRYEEQLILVLSRLRLGLVHHDLAYRLDVSVMTISHLWSFWIDLLTVKLIHESARLNRDTAYDPKNRIILECVETFIDNSSAQLVGSKSYSRAKGVIEVTPKGFISFVSDLYPGSISERELQQQCNFSEVSDVVNRRNVFLCENVSTVGRITALQTNIQRILGLIKGFKILKGVFPNSVHSHAQLNNFWKICCFLINFINRSLLKGAILPKS